MLTTFWETLCFGIMAVFFFFFVSVYEPIRVFSASFIWVKPTSLIFYRHFGLDFWWNPFETRTVRAVFDLNSLKNYSTRLVIVLVFITITRAIFYCYFYDFFFINLYCIWRTLKKKKNHIWIVPIRWDNGGTVYEGPVNNFFLFYINKVIYLEKTKKKRWH